MRALLDTHTFLWAYADQRRLSASATDILTNPDNEIFISAVSFWEIALKASIGKLKLVGEQRPDLIGVAEELGFKTLSLTVEEAATYDKLKEGTHFDPFDRMLIWQAISQELTVISADSEFKKFVPDGLKLLW